jgi:putative membrane protein
MHAPLALLSLVLAQAAQAPLGERLGRGIIETILYSLIGIVMTVIGFKVVDWLMPGDLPKQIAIEKNVPISIVAAAMILGIAIIIAAAIASPNA